MSYICLTYICHMLPIVVHSLTEDSFAQFHCCGKTLSAFILGLSRTRYCIERIECHNIYHMGSLALQSCMLWHVIWFSMFAQTCEFAVALQTRVAGKLPDVTDDYSYSGGS